MSDKDIISKSTVDGHIDQRPVMLFELGNTALYYFSEDNTILALLLLDGNRIKAIKNFTNTKGYVSALINYVVNVKGTPLKITSSEGVTLDGFKWITNLIGKRGFTITDQNGDKIDIELLKDEWVKSKTTGGAIHGPTEVNISESNTTWKQKLQEQQTSLMPCCYFEMPPYKKNISESAAVIKEIGYADHLSNLSMSDKDIISKSTVDGQIGNRDVLKLTIGASTIYFFSTDDKIDALLLLNNNNLVAMKNFTPNKGLIYGLFNYLVNIKQQKLIIDPSELFTEYGFNWIVNQISRKDGFKITDLNGNQVNIDDLRKEWEQSRYDEFKTPGPTGLIIGESMFGKKLRENESSLMVYDVFNVLGKGMISEGKDIFNISNRN